MVPGPEDVKRILLIRPGGMGDMVVLLPALTALSFRLPQTVPYDRLHAEDHG